MTRGGSRRRLRAAVLPLLLLAGWTFASTLGARWAYVFVPPGEVAASFVALLRDGDLLTHLGATLATALIGLAVGGAAGVLLGAALATARPLDLLLGPLFNALRQVPTIGLIPLIALWFGMGEFSIRLLVAIAVFEVMTLNTREGLRMVEPRYLEAGRALLFTRGQTFARILLPAALPSIVTGLLQAVSIAWMATIGAELLLTAGPGLGVVMERAQLAVRMSDAIVCLILIGLLGCAMNAGFAAAGRRVMRWSHTG